MDVPEYKYPAYQLSIGEQHAVTFAAGLAAESLKPIVAIYSTFLHRAYDPLIHAVALQNLLVVFAIDRAGIVGADGVPHLGCDGSALLRCIPGMIVMAASNENECRQMLYTAQQPTSLTVVRYSHRQRGSTLTCVPDVKDTHRDSCNSA
ncbi:TPA: hypothetical protein I8235_001897 [Kluyvera intermedia]|nr:hypothetical protein [Kluyvera intermedia]